MKTPSKFFSKKKKKDLLLANADIRKPSYYQAMDDTEEPEAEMISSPAEAIESRDDRNFVRDLTELPYQIAKPSPASVESNGHPRQPSSDADMLDDFLGKVSFQEDTWDHEMLSPKKDKKTKFGSKERSCS